MTTEEKEVTDLQASTFRMSLQVETMSAAERYTYQRSLELILVEWAKLKLEKLRSDNDE